MSGVQKIIAIGNCGRDPESMVSPNGTVIAEVSIAVSEKWKKDGQSQERTEWLNLVFFGKLAEIVQQYVTKGSKIYIEGKLRTSSWEKDGQKHYRTDIVCDSMQMLDSRNGGPAAAQSQPTGRPQPSAPALNDFDNFDDDIPF
jgi:single-strand DNA-binding protein